jgi:cytochrome c553
MNALVKSAMIVLAIAAVPTSALAADPAAGAKKTATCVACHGQNGIGIAPNYPNLACQKDKYLVKAIKEFKSGVRKDPMMQPMVAALSDADIENVAAYYSTLGCK